MAANAKKNEVTLKDRWLWLKEYVSNTYNELKKVHWPTRNQIMGYTAVVLFTVLLVSMIIWVFDSVLGKGMEALFNAVGK